MRLLAACRHVTNLCPKTIAAYHNHNGVPRGFGCSARSGQSERPKCGGQIGRHQIATMASATNASPPIWKYAGRAAKPGKQHEGIQGRRRSWGTWRSWIRG
jgi:hypothetical protein